MKVYKNKVRLEDMQGVRRLMARTINLLLDGELAEDRAKAIGYLCNIMTSIIKTSELENRLTDIEEALAKTRKKGA